MVRQGRVAVYIRTEQGGHEFVDSQLRRLIGWLGVRRSAVLVYRDCCLDHTWPRPGFSRLLSDVVRGRITHVAASGWDRFTGNRKALDQILVDLASLGVTGAALREDKLGEGQGLERIRSALDRATVWHGAYYWAPVPNALEESLLLLRVADPYAALATGAV